MSKKDISALAVNNTIQLFYGEDNLNIQKNQHPELFDRIFKIIESGNSKELKKQFFDIKKELEKYTKGTFHKKEDGNLYLKGDDEPIPTLVANKLIQFKNAKEDFMPLVRFWKKLKQNLDKRIREQLYAFMQHNNIPITDLGDVICEKGVKERNDGTLVDQRTGKFDNSIGMIVQVPRETVVTDPNQTCAAGLHVAAPDFVRNHWSSGLIIEVSVDPSDFVAIPNDYNNTKARVCRYQVLGLAKKEARKELKYNFDDIVIPTFGAIEEQKKRSGFSPKEAKDYSKKRADKIDFTKMTANAIIEHVNKEYDVEIRIDPKNKKAIIKKANFIEKTNGKRLMVIYVTEAIERGYCGYSYKGLALNFTAQEMKDFYCSNFPGPGTQKDYVLSINNKNKKQIMKALYDDIQKNAALSQYSWGKQIMGQKTTRRIKQ